MRRLESVPARACLALCLAVACRDRPADDTAMHRVEPAPVQPANPEPAPSAANEPAPAAAAPAEPEAQGSQPAAAVRDMPRVPPQARAKPAAKPAAAKPAESKPVAAKPAAPKPAASKPAKRAPAAPSAVAPEPVAAAAEPPPAPSEPPPAPPPVAKPATRVVIPNTARVRVEVPAGLQRWLDADTRMQPWLNKVMDVIDNCYANVVADSPNAAGTITFRVTMHENARPDPDIQSLPGALSGVVTCATGQLMRARMPLFTGTEGESYVVKVKFGG